MKTSNTASERVLVTGASGGIGEALARRFARARHDLILVARSEDKLKARAKQLTERHHINVSLANSYFKQPPEAEIAGDSVFPSGSYGDQ